MGEGRSAVGALLAVCLLMLGGCATDSKLRKAELAQLIDWLPGHYDNLAQTAAERGSNGGASEALSVAIVPVYAPMLGEHVFYFQEMSAKDPRRIFEQRLLSFTVAEDDRIVQSQWSFTEPLRWRDAHLNTDLFKGLMPQDIRASSGCELIWNKDGERFTAENDPQRCRASSRAGGQVTRVEARAELGPDELALSERIVDSQGRLVSGRAEEPFYRFIKRGD